MKSGAILLFPSRSLWCSQRGRVEGSSPGVQMLCLWQQQLWEFCAQRGAPAAQSIFLFAGYVSPLFKGAL